MNKEQIIKTLSELNFPGNITLTDIVSGIVIKENKIGLTINVDKITTEQADILEKDAKKLLLAQPKIQDVIIIKTGSRKTDTNNTKAPSQAHTATRRLHKIDNIKNIIPIISGKGGVGKSTIAVTIAQNLAKQGFKVGILDLDIYGPSIPLITKTSGHPEQNSYNKIIPHLSAEGIKILSIGFFIDPNKAAIWRGPMLGKVLEQLLLGAEWDELDYLILDTPPGTGDMHLSLLEKFELNGAIAVSTPQEIATIDVKKIIDMYRKFSVEIIGLVENMSYFQQTDSTEKIYLFGQGGAKKLTQQLNIPLIAQIAIYPEIDKYYNINYGLANLKGMNVNFLENLKK